MLNKLILLRFLVAVLGLMSLSAHAGWALDSERSSLHFVSIKNGTTAEVHNFAELKGTVGDDGKVNLDVYLDSVDTNIAIRDERMREMLFEIEKMPTATVTAQIDVASIQQMSEGSIGSKDVRLTLSLHGQEQGFDTVMKIIKLADGGVAVSTEEPLLVEAKAFDLAEGVEALREIAGLSSIAIAVPVTVNLVFQVAD
ncbi:MULTISPECIES: YceI family protein [unclassified Marinobacter]|uniref:YceI family protein n=1 Tax=unclassified Marinobacter TaxID=83889 RepID=UPI0026E1A16D|nr:MULTISPECIES: YceI family protein [unclassified Marinobacter]MDO6440891.1 YceI family protein [Marinobacter sp. 2_MG-2023]MDO6823719.1 YceI family protein [Marinobacter sp. 1_MG-2023]